MNDMSVTTLLENVVISVWPMVVFEEVNSKTFRVVETMFNNAFVTMRVAAHARCDEETSKGTIPPAIRLAVYVEEVNEIYFVTMPVAAPTLEGASGS